MKRFGRAVAALFNRAIVYNPIVHGLLIYAGASLLFTFTGSAAILVAFAAAMVYSVVSPVLIAVRPRWWLNGPLSLVMFIVLIDGLPATVEAITHQRVGDDAMVMLGPFMFYPVMLLGSLVFHLIRNRRARIA